MKRTAWASSGVALNWFAGVLIALTALAAPSALAADRIPPVEGPSIRLDFAPSPLETWVEGIKSEVVRKGVPRLDGVRWENVTGAALWQKAARLEPLVRPTPKTEFLAFYTDEGLFFRANNFFDPAHPPQAMERERDMPKGGEDVIEIRLRVPRQQAGQGRYRRQRAEEAPLYHFLISQAGSIYDARGGRSEYDPQWRSRVQTEKGVWTAWVMVPFSALELPHAVPEVAINIGRTGQAVSLLSWGPSWGSTEERLLVLEGVPADKALKVDASADGSETAAPDARSLASGRGLALNWVSGVARPQDRWIDAEVLVDPQFAAAPHEVEVGLFALGATSPVETVRAAVARPNGALRVDSRRWGIGSGKVVARLLRNGEAIAAVESLIEAKALPAPFAEGFRIPLKVDVAAGPALAGPWPLNAGVPFPAGSLWSAEGWRVEDAEGRAYPTQLEITGRWAEQGSFQWLRVDTLADPKSALFLTRRADAAPVSAQAVRATRQGDRVELSNGLVTYDLGAERSPILAIRRNGATLATAEGTRGLYLVDQKGRTAHASAQGAEVRVEAEGPVAACVRIEGDYRTPEGEALARHITRVELFAGHAFARVTHTLVLTRDTNQVWFRDLGWEFALADGANTEALFGTSRTDPAAHARLTAGDAAEELYLIQDGHYRFGAGENRFRLMQGERQALAGEEMGDWFLVQHRAAGLLLACKDSARQHPKEFRVRGTLLDLRLFSSRAGEELDFRSTALAEKWNLINWFTNDGNSRTTKAKAEEMVENVKRIPSNAVGWAKTHQILVAPAWESRAPEQAAALSARHSNPVFALADPQWIHRSAAMGPLHPRDTERFPEAEKLIDATLAFFASRVPLIGEWGFVDYWAGPHLNHSSKYPQPRRWRLTYTVRPDSWRVFARSGLRDAYDFATSTNRAWLDNCLAHQSDGAKVKGLYTNAAGADRADSAASLPYYWGNSTVTNVSSSTNLNQFLFDYHLTGYRRAGDAIRNFAEGLKKDLTPQGMTRDWRILMTFRTIIQCYNFTWDPTLKALAYAAADTFEDQEGAIGLTKERPYRSSVYKTRVDVRALLEAWQLFGDARYHRLTRQVGEYLWNSYLGEFPITYVNPQGILGHFFYEETRDPMIAQNLLMQMRWAASTLKTDAQGPGVVIGAHAATFIFEGIPAIQDVITRTNADRQPVASWVGVSDFENPVEMAFYKKDQESARFIVKTPSNPGHSVGGSVMEAINPSATAGMDTLSAFQQRSGESDGTGRLYTRWVYPKDAPEGAAKVTPSAFGIHYGVTGGKQPLVLHAPSYWAPYPKQSPAVPWFFKVPQGAKRPAIFFEGHARLYSPDGTLFKEVADKAQWIDLPEDKPGLWSFAPLESRLVRVRNLPPFFAAEHRESYFDPGIPWSPEAEQPAEAAVKPPAKSGFVAGASGRPSDQALYIAPRGAFEFSGGAPLEGGGGTEFLPFHQGTIEFWFRPDWGSFTLPRGRRVSQRILQMKTEANPWDMFYYMDYSDDSMLWSHSLYAIAYGEKKDEPRRTFRCWRRYTILEPSEWVHIAMVWGPQSVPTIRGQRSVLKIQLFVNGKLGNRQPTDAEGYLPADRPLSLEFARLGGAIDQLRISDVMRYTRNFEVPSPLTGLDADEHTRAWFPFNGTLDGVSGAGKTVTATLTP